MTRFTKMIAVASTVAALAAPTVGATPSEFVSGVTDFPSANRTEKFVPGATDFPSVHRTGTSYHAVVSAPRPAPAPLAADRFAWGDAGIGAGAGVVLTLLAVGSALALRRQTGALA